MFMVFVVLSFWVEYYIILGGIVYIGYGMIGFF